MLLRGDIPSCTAGLQQSQGPHLPTLQLAQPRLSTTSPNWSAFIGTASLLNQRRNPQSDCILHRMLCKRGFGHDYFHTKSSKAKRANKKAVLTSDSQITILSIQISQKRVLERR